jgi:F-type H+-transporting ATPase subunit a
VLWKFPEVSLAPEVIWNPGGVFPITNTLLCTWITIIALVAFFYFGTRKAALIPSGFQNFVEWVIEFLLNLVNSVVGTRRDKAARFFPWVASFFIFILVANLMDVLPGIDTIGSVKGQEIAALPANCGTVLGFLPACRPISLGPIQLLFGNISNLITPWFRPPTTDLNLTVAMALLSVGATQFFGFYHLGAKEHLLKYFNFRALRKGPLGLIDLVVGLLEIISETARIISFSFRLFGNIFAGSLVLAAFAFILPFISTIIFIPFEIFVAVMQALIFALLTLVFMEIGTTSHEAHEEHLVEEEQKVLQEGKTAA